jgi:hypothetical protein
MIHASVPKRVTLSTNLAILIGLGIGGVLTVCWSGVLLYIAYRAASEFF